MVVNMAFAPHQPLAGSGPSRPDPVPMMMMMMMSRCIVHSSLRAQQATAAAGAPATAASSCTRPLAQAADFDGGAPKKYVAGMVAGRIVRVAASGADSIDEVQTLSIRLPNGDLRSWQVPRGTPVESITEELEKELPPYHEAKLFARDEILCGGTIADEVEGEVTLVKMPSITKAVAALDRLHSESYMRHCRFLTQPQYQELLQALRFIAQHEEFLEKAHATTLFATVYNMYVDDWEVAAAGEANAASGAAIESYVGDRELRGPTGILLCTRPELNFYMEMVLRVVGRLCELSAAAGILFDLRIARWRKGSAAKVFRKHCLEALEQIQKNHQGTEEFQLFAQRHGGQYGICAAPASGGLWAFAPQITRYGDDDEHSLEQYSDDDGDDDDDDDDDE